MRSKFLFLISFLSIILLTATVYATEAYVPLTLSTDEGSGFYRYAFPNGSGFVSMVQNNEVNALMAVFQFDPEISYQLSKNGVVTEYASNDVIGEAGSYSLRVWTDDGSTAVFTFSIMNTDFIPEFTMPDIDSFMLGETVTDAELVLTDFSAGMFVYGFENGEYFKASVPRGGTADGAVRMEFSGGLMYTVRKDGQVVDYFGGDFEEPGVYTVSINTVRPPAITDPTGDLTGSQQLVSGYTADFHFRILTPATNQMRVYNAPQDFIITNVLRDGKPWDFGRQSCWLLQDGLYIIALQCTVFPELNIDIAIHLDTSAPFLRFSTDLSGVTYNKVEIVPPAGCAISASLNGEKYPIVNNTLTRVGRYRITASDDAGNSRVYRINILYGVQLTFVGLLVPAALTVVVIAVVVLFTRRNMNVR